ncbi:hypothetical protein UFOVP739_17 [uncultured Caudovirales phage]|uniref:Uncharacterized protein n=1 Tax=uncultured Caudovirales phage TaxID=2100421 RepID=A0A6J7X221_9CAUD|nr:hypothetical protein UFOVP739_17 [uncultured Caudovirales phage]
MIHAIVSWVGFGIIMFTTIVIIYVGMSGHK